MTNFPGSNDDLDTFASRAATEAVLGLLIQGTAVHQEMVHDWLEASIGEADPFYPSQTERPRRMVIALVVPHHKPGTVASWQ